MFLNPMDRREYRHNDEYTEYVAVDIGGLLNFEQLTALIQQAAAKLPSNQQLKAGENWGYYIQVHTSDHTAQAVIVRPYPLISWADKKLRELLGHLKSLSATAQPVTAFATA